MVHVDPLWELLPLRTRMHICREAAPEWVESFPNEFRFRLNLMGSWEGLPSKVKRLVRMWIQAKKREIDAGLQAAIALAERRAAG
jgi:hypothetical protein